MATDDGGYSLALAFDTDDPEFCRGVEAGRLWEQLENPGEIRQTIHASNAEMVMRMCEAKGRTYSAMDLENGIHMELKVDAL